MCGQRLDPAQLGDAGEQVRDQHDAQVSEVDSSAAVAPEEVCADLDQTRTHWIDITP